MQGACPLGQNRVLCMLCLVQFCGVRFETPISPFFRGCFSGCSTLAGRHISAQLLLLFGSEAVEHGGELSSTLDHHICGYAVGVVFGFYCGGLDCRGTRHWAGRLLGGEGLGEWLQGLVFWSCCGGQASGLLCQSFPFILGVRPGSSESWADGMRGRLVCSVICAVLLLILSS